MSNPVDPIVAGERFPLSLAVVQFVPAARSELVGSIPSPDIFFPKRLQVCMDPKAQTDAGT